jgi:tRNA(Ile)-lysidine synthase
LSVRKKELYHVSVHELAQRVLGHVRRERLLAAGDRLGVAVSGGIDSVALLRLLLELRHELGIVLSVVHFNHQLRGADADADQEFVANVAHEHDLPFLIESADVTARAAEAHVSLEAAARELRYGFFRHLLGEYAESTVTLDVVATGHTLDDQAETVLLRLIRGTGLKGLGGIHPRIPVEDAGEEVSAEIVRPLLRIRRRELEKYLRELKQPWREDSTNADDRFTRNRVRQLVLPLLEREFNPAVAENLAELAEIARGEEDYWENEASGWWGTTVQWSLQESESPLVQIQPHGPTVPHRREDPEPPARDASVNRVWLLTEPLAVQRRVVKAVGESVGIPLEFKHVEEILRFAAEQGVSGKELSLPLGWRLVRESEALVFVASDPGRQQRIPRNYEYELPVPGQALVVEANSTIEARRLPPEAQESGYNPDHLLDPDFLPRMLRVRNWRPGDRYWPAHTKSPKKIKELLQERHVAQPERRVWPVVVNGDEIVWVRGFPAPAKLRAKPGRLAVLIQEMPLPGIAV